MIILITGASHTGKTALAQRLMEKYHYPYFSIDHLKMGLIRTKNTELTPMSSDRELTAYLWPIVREMIKTAIENDQNLIVEGCYIPFDWEKDFGSEYLEHIRYFCLVMSADYIDKHFEDIKKFASVIENRMDDEYCTIELVRRDNAKMLEQCLLHKANYILIDEEYHVEVELEPAQNWTYRKAVPADLERIWNYNIADNPGDDRWKVWKEQYISYNEKNEAATFVALCDGEPVGEGTLLFSRECGAINGRTDLADNRKIANINALRIRKEYEGTGHISALVRKMERYAEKLGYTTLTIGVEAHMTRNIGIYLHWGYEKFVRGEVEDGTLVLYYAKELCDISVCTECIPGIFSYSSNAASAP